MADTAVGAMPERSRLSVKAFFSAIGDRIAAAIGSDPADAIARLDAIAAHELKNANPAANISFAEIIEYVLSAETVCPQADLDAKFAEPPCSLYHGGTFDISALVWLDGTTSIHQHAFSGAFHVLAGSSIHSQYRFHPDAETEPGERAKTGSLELCGLEVLRTGDTRAIKRGPDLIHALFHMVRPSVTIVVRTICDKPEAGPQYDYRWPGVAFDPFQRHAPTIRRLQYLRMLRTLDAGTYPQHLQRVLANADVFLAYTIISEEVLAQSDIRSAPDLVSQCLKLSQMDRRTILAAAHNDLISRTLINLRAKLHHPPHRFLLALLLNVFDRERLLDLVAQEWQTEQPVALLRTWMAELCGLTDRFPNLLNLDMNDTTLNVLDRLWHGESDAAMLAWFHAEFGTEAIVGQESALRAVYVALRDCPLFYQVFAKQRESESAAFDHGRAPACD